jgi:hypothetical protein
LGCRHGDIHGIAAIAIRACLNDSGAGSSGRRDVWKRRNSRMDSAASTTPATTTVPPSKGANAVGTNEILRRRCKSQPSNIAMTKESGGGNGARPENRFVGIDLRCEVNCEVTRLNDGVLLRFTDGDDGLDGED